MTGCRYPFFTKALDLLMFIHNTHTRGVGEQIVLNRGLKLTFPSSLTGSSSFESADATRRNVVGAVFAAKSGLGGHCTAMWFTMQGRASIRSEGLTVYRRPFVRDRILN